jgi:hypothetical protein
VSCRCCLEGVGGGWKPLECAELHPATTRMRRCHPCGGDLWLERQSYLIIVSEEPHTCRSILLCCQFHCNACISHVQHGARISTSECMAHFYKGGERARRDGACLFTPSDMLFPCKGCCPQCLVFIRRSHLPKRTYNAVFGMHSAEALQPLLSQPLMVQFVSLCQLGVYHKTCTTHGVPESS